MPIDAKPDYRAGNIVLAGKPGHPQLAIVIGGMDRDRREMAKGFGVELRTSHFATCPNASQHRKRGSNGPKSKD